jgi:hypothetical protein
VASIQKQKHRESRAGAFYIRGRRLETTALDGLSLRRGRLDNAACEAFDRSGGPSCAPVRSRGCFRIMLAETQKAPNRIAPTKTNAAHSANTLSFVATSIFVVALMRRTSVTVAQRVLAEIGAAQKRGDCCNAAAFWCAAHFSTSLCQHHEICKQFHASKKVPQVANKNFMHAARFYMTVRRHPSRRKAETNDQTRGLFDRPTGTSRRQVASRRGDQSPIARARCSPCAFARRGLK